MPNRILYERICGSQTLADLTPEEEVFFYRLLVQCDDFGRYDARPPILRARCFALQLERVSEEHIGAYLASLERVGLLSVYAVDGRPYLQITTWQKYQRTRSSESRFPGPQSAGLVQEERQSESSEEVVKAATPRSAAADPSIKRPRGQPHANDSGLPRDADNGAPILPYSYSYPESNSYANAEFEVEEEHPPANDRAPRRAPATPPAALARFDAVLRDLNGYRPSADFFAKVQESYPTLDLEREAIALADYVRRKRLQCTTARVFNWLNISASGPKERTNGAHRANAGRPGEDPAGLEALAKY